MCGEMFYVAKFPSLLLNEIQGAALCFPGPFL